MYKSAQAGESASQSRVMLQFQELMGRFLDTQKQVMLAYLQTSAGTTATEDTIKAPVAAINAPLETPAPPPRKVDPPAQRSIPRPVPEPAVIVHAVNGSIDADLKPVQNGRLPQFDRQQITKQLLQIVSDRTGYPLEMLDLNADLEADLGIDSIKRVEILGAVEGALDLSNRAGTGFAVDDLTKLKTLGKIADAIHAGLPAELNNGSAAPAAFAQAGSKKN